MKKRNCILLLITITLLISMLIINIQTIYFSQQRIIQENNNIPIIELIQETEKQTEEFIDLEKDTIVVEKTNSFNKKELTIVTISSIIMGVCIVILVFTNLGKKSIKEIISNRKSLSYCILTLILVCSILPATNIIYSDKKILNNKNTLARNEKSTALIEIITNKTANNLNKESLIDDTSVIQVTNNSKYIVNNSTLNKNAGETSDKEASEYFGLNSAILIKASSSIELNDSNISTSSNYSSALFLSGAFSTANLNAVNLKTIRDYSYGISVLDEGSVIAYNVTINTIGNNSSATKIINENSTLAISDSIINTAGYKSPLFFCNGKIEATNINGISLNSPLVILKDSSSLSIEGSELYTNTNEDDNLYSSAITIYKESSSTSLDDYNISDITIKNSNITINKQSKNYKTAPIFNVSNTKTTINISESEFKYGSNIILNVESTDANNISEVTMNITKQSLKGNIIADKNSKVLLNLNDSTYKGIINKGNISKNIDIRIDTKSKWILTGSSYVNKLTVPKDNLNNIRKYINSNGYNIYYNAKSNKWLNGRTINLTGGGKLIPKYYKS